jgi:DNA-binding response OmpR family regulator
VFNADPKTIQKIAPHLHRVLIVDPAPVSVRVLSDLMKEMGAREFLAAAQTTQALLAADDFDPQLIFVEFAGEKLDGLDFTQRLRRSRMRCRQVPVIMITAEATPTSIIGARNSGVHEFLKKPFTAGDLYRRVENVVLKPRPWIEASMYVGPDRRRFNSGEFSGAKKRRTDRFKPIYADAAG